MSLFLVAFFNYFLVVDCPICFLYMHDVSACGEIAHIHCIVAGMESSCRHHFTELIKNFCFCIIVSSIVLYIDKIFCRVRSNRDFCWISHLSDSGNKLSAFFN
jgi:hypothetical protein